MSINRPLGSNQVRALRMLVQHGPWFRGCDQDWSLGNRWEPERILKTLVRRGLVAVAVQDGGRRVYTLEAGADRRLRYLDVEVLNESPLLPLTRRYVLSNAA